MGKNNSSKNRFRFRILSLLIKKYENSKASMPGQTSKLRPQFTMGNSPLADDYSDEMEHQKREAIHEALAELQGLGVIEVKWARFQEGRQVEKVYLEVEQVRQAYELAGLVPKQEKIEKIAECLVPLQDHSWDWVREWWADGMNQLNKGKAPVGIDLEDQAGAVELVEVLLALPNIKGVMAKRTFSQMVFHDTKRFEQSVEKRLLAVIKSFGQLEFEQEEDYLDQLGLVVHPKISMVAGPIVFRIQGQRMDVGLLPGGVGLTGETIAILEVSEIRSSRILLVENLTCYHHVVQESEGEMVVIFTGGFPHRHLQKLLQRIAAFLKEKGAEAPEVYHWGDLDYGGIRIFEFIRRQLMPSLLPYRMDVLTYEKFSMQGIPFGDLYERKLRTLLEDERYTEWKPVVEAILREGYRVEQESLLR